MTFINLHHPVLTHNKSLTHTQVAICTAMWNTRWDNCFVPSLGAKYEKSNPSPRVELGQELGSHMQHIKVT